MVMNERFETEPGRWDYLVSENTAQDRTQEWNGEERTLYLLPSYPVCAPRLPISPPRLSIALPIPPIQITHRKQTNFHAPTSESASIQSFLTTYSIQFPSPPSLSNEDNIKIQQKKIEKEALTQHPKQSLSPPRPAHSAPPRTHRCALHQSS